MNNIVLIGFATAYKSSVGKLLANKLCCQWFDTDIMVEQHSGKSAGQLIELYGQQSLRQEELQVIATLPKENCIISCGGGVPLSDKSMQLLKDNNAVVVWLKVNAKTVEQRLKQGCSNRPLHQGLDIEQLRQFIAERDVIYSQYADMSVVTDGLPSDNVADIILQKLAL